MGSELREQFALDAKRLSLVYGFYFHWHDDSQVELELSPNVNVSLKGPLHVIASVDDEANVIRFQVHANALPKDISAIIGQYITKTTNERSHSLRQAIRWIDNHFTSIAEEALKVKANSDSSALGSGAATNAALQEISPRANADEASEVSALLSKRYGDSVIAEPWSYAEQLSLENAVAHLICVEHRPIDNVETWSQISQSVGKPASACLLRYLIARGAALSWKAAVNASAEASTGTQRTTSGGEPPGTALRNVVNGSVPTATEPSSSTITEAAARVNHANSGIDISPNSLSHQTAEVESSKQKDKSADFAASSAVTATEERASTQLRGINASAGDHGWLLHLEGFESENVGLVAALGVTLLVSCADCHELSHMTVKGASIVTGDEDAGGADSAASENTDVMTHESKQWCEKCGQLMIAKFSPTFIFTQRAVVGNVDTVKCTPISLIAVALVATCLQCMEMVSVGRFAPPRPWHVHCRQCHAALRVHASEAVIAEASSHARPAVQDNSSQHPGRRLPPGVVRGSPLPANGTCSHYRESYRWLRFPCCGMVYPCDECHNEASDHVNEWAQRMICGWCSREQQYSQGPCMVCGASLTRSSGTYARYWHGGAGQRVRAFMSRNDPHKYKGRGFKTASRKSERVGPEGARRRKAKEAKEAKEHGEGD